MAPTLVLGAGLTGLSLGYRLAQSGREVLVLEGADRVGGCIRSDANDGFIAEAGPNSLLTKPASDHLLEDLKLNEMESDKQAPRYIARYGRPIALKPGPGAALAPILSWPAKFRVPLDLVKGSPAELEDESIADFFTRRFGPEVAHYLAGPFVSGVYAGDPAKISTRSAFPKLWEAERTYRVGVIRGFTRMRKDMERRGIPRPSRRTVNFAGGLEDLPRALASRLGDQVVTDAKVTALERSGGDDGRWSITTTDGRRFGGDQVVSTLPAHRLLPILTPLAPDAEQPLRRVETVSVVSASISYPTSAFPELPVGFGTLIPRSEGFRILGCLYVSSLFPGRAPEGEVLLTCFIGGAFDPDAVGLSDDELTSLLADEVARLLGVSGRPTLRSVTRWKQGIPQYTMGHHVRMGELEQAIAPLEGFHVTGNWKDGVALADRVEAAYRLADSLNQA